MPTKRGGQVDSALLDFAVRFVNRSAEEQISFLIRAEEELAHSKDDAKAIALRLVWELYRRAASKRMAMAVGVRRGA